METNLNQPSNDEGLEGVKKRLGSDAVAEKIAALTEAFNYGQAGLNLVIDVLKDESSPIQSVAYLLLQERAEQQVKEALGYYEKKIKSRERYQEFIIQAVHALRTPLYGMIGFLKIILEGMADDPEQERDFLEKAHKLALNLGERLNDILDITKIEAGQMQLELGEVKLDELFKDVENFTQPLVQRKHLSLSLEMPTNHHEITLYGNYHRLMQVISDLVENAIKFTHEGGIKITAEVIKKKDYFDSRELLNTMIQIKVNGDVTDNYNGYFNLGISKRLVENMGGKMSFHEGDTVTFTIPMYFSS